jgi:hypothetical protein
VNGVQILIMLGAFILGAAATIYGVALISPAAAWITFGVFCLTIAVWPLLRRG